MDRPSIISIGNRYGKFPPLVPRPLWLKIERILPKGKPHPLGCGRKRCSDREILAAYALLRNAGVKWADLPMLQSTKISKATLNRRVKLWERSGVFEKLKNPKFSYFDSRIGMDWHSLFNNTPPRATRDRLVVEEVASQYWWRKDSQDARGRRRNIHRHGVQIPNVVWNLIKLNIPTRKLPNPGALEDRDYFNAIVTKFFFGVGWDELSHYGYASPKDVYRQFREWKALSVFKDLADTNIDFWDRQIHINWLWLSIELPNLVKKSEKFRAPA